MVVALRIVPAAAMMALLCQRAFGAEHQPGHHAIAVVVGNSSAVRSISKDALRDIYLRRQRLWSDGTRAVPINLPPDSPMREEFAKLVLGRSTQDMVAYWNSRYFEGTMPPQVLSSPAAIRGFLAAEPGAIAYIPLADVDQTCRTLLILDPDSESRTSGGNATEPSTPSR